MEKILDVFMEEKKILLEGRLEDLEKILNKKKEALRAIDSLRSAEILQVKEFADRNAQLIKIASDSISSLSRKSPLQTKNQRSRQFYRKNGTLQSYDQDANLSMEIKY